jgi:hypothetical protein
MDEKTTRMVFATAAVAAVAAVIAGPAGAVIPQGNGVQPIGGQSAERRQSRAAEPLTVPYLSQGIGVDASQFAGEPPRTAGVHAALAKRHGSTTATPLTHCIQVVLSPPSEAQPLGLTGDSAATRVAAPEPLGLTGDSAATRYPVTASQPSTRTVSSGEDFDWTSFGAGAGMVALLAAALGGVLLTARKRHSVGLP